MNLASFVIPSYNSAAWLAHAVQSAQEQTHKDIEIVIVNDASTDSTPKYLSWLVNQGDKRIKVHNNVKNLGRSESRNLGNSIATGDFIFVLDADDISAPNRVALTIKKFNESGIGFIYGSSTLMDAVGRGISDVRADVFNLKRALETQQNRIVHSSVAYTRDFAKKYRYEGGDIAKLGIDDWHQQITAALDGQKFDYVPQTICAHRVHSAAITSTRDEVVVRKLKEKILAERTVPA